MPTVRTFQNYLDYKEWKILYDYICGKVDSAIEDYVVIDVNGVGFKIFTSAYTVENIKYDENTKIFTHMVVKEDDIVLYGFLTRKELKLFKLLISVSGIGPKVANSLLSQFDTEQIINAILMKDINLIIKAPGIGKKTAERIFLELKDKVTFEEILVGSTPLKMANELSEVIEALISLGYNYSIASNAVSKIEDKSKSIDILIKEALKLLSTK